MRVELPFPFTYVRIYKSAYLLLIAADPIVWLLFAIDLPNAFRPQFFINFVIFSINILSWVLYVSDSPLHKTGLICESALSIGRLVMFPAAFAGFFIVSPVATVFWMPFFWLMGESAIFAMIVLLAFLYAEIKYLRELHLKGC
jgi:hypothetical protein